MSKTVLLIGSLDTKGDEYAFVRDLITARGHTVRLMDVGVLQDPPFAVDVSAERVAEAGATALSALQKARLDRCTCTASTSACL